MSAEETFERDLTDLAVLGRRDRRDGRPGGRAGCGPRRYSGRTVTLKLRRYDFTTLTRSQTLPQPDRRRPPDRRGRPSAARPRRARGGGLRLLGVGVSGLSVYAQGDLFAEDDEAPPSATDEPHDAVAASRHRPPPGRTRLVAGAGRAARRARRRAGCGGAGWAGSPSASRAPGQRPDRCAPWPPTTRRCTRRSAGLARPR